jgi:hypothetical protein
VKEYTRLNTLPACRSSADARTSTALTAAGSCATGDTIADIHACTAALDAIVNPPPVCNCCSKTVLNVTSGLPSAAKTGELLDDTGAHVLDLTAGGLYFGGGLAGTPLPLTIPSSVNTQVAITSCDPATGNITIGPRTAAQTGSNANCSATGCLFGPPMPLPNPTGTSTSTCKVAVVGGSPTGSGNCSGSISSLNLQLIAGIYLTGDLDPSIPGIQPCPICTGGTCKGGPNDGLACTPGTTTTGDAYPTSNDCPPPAGSFLGNEPVSIYGTADTLTKTAVDNPAVQTNVFCGYCATNAGVFQNPPQSCTTNATCTTGTFTKCRQRSGGAFATDFLGLNTARTITETGAAAICLADGAAHDATLVSMFCAPPAYNGLIDGSNDLPGPGAASARVTIQLLP